MSVRHINSGKAAGTCRIHPSVPILFILAIDCLIKDGILSTAWSEMTNNETIWERTGRQPLIPLVVDEIVRRRWRWI